MKIEVGDIIQSKRPGETYIGTVIGAHPILAGVWRISVYDLMYEYLVLESNICLHVPGSNFSSLEEKIDYIKVIKEMS